MTATLNNRAPILKIMRISSTGAVSYPTNASASGLEYGLAVLQQSTTTLRPFIASRVWNAVWNDYADLQLLSDELIPGKCYFDTADGAKICTERCQMSVIGIASDTFAHIVGLRDDIKQVPIAVSGWALAYVDKEYPCGTPLTNNEHGELTEITLEEKRDYPERIVAIYKRKELMTEFGTEDQKVIVNNRHWVKVK